MELIWHGHSTWRVTVGETSMLIDPFFDNPATSLDPSDVETPDYVLLTHGHADHIAHAGEFDGATVVATPELTGYVEAEMGVEETIGMNIGGTVELGDAFVSMVRADHTNGINTGYEHDAGVPGGYMISNTKPTQESDADSTTFYHAGDTGLMTDMREIFGPYYEPDVAALPVGDHYTMGPWQAAVAADWLGVDRVFPMHYNTFPAIEIDISDFEREVKAAGSLAEVRVLDGDESVTLE